MLREPDVADAGPADVYSLAKTFWVLAADQRYPPEGQIRVDVAEHDLGRRTHGGGTLALGLVLERATSAPPHARPMTAELAAQLEEWAQGGAARDDVAGAGIRRRYVERLGDNLAESLDSKAFPEVEEQMQKILAEARKRNNEREIELSAEALARGRGEPKRVPRRLRRAGSARAVVPSVRGGVGVDLLRQVLLYRNDRKREWCDASEREQAGAAGCQARRRSSLRSRCRAGTARMCDLRAARSGESESP